MALPIVGAHFRPPAKALLEVLPSGAPLWLRPEPDNPYDANAIQVGVDRSEIEALSQAMKAELETLALGYGFDLEGILSEPEWHLGYIPRTVAASLTLAPGKHPASLAFDPAGKPMVATAKADASAPEPS